MRFKLPLLYLILALTSIAGCRAKPPQILPHTFSLINQHTIGKNACGPASLVNALILSDNRWKVSLRRYSTSISAVRDVIQTYGKRPSITFPSRFRWKKEAGINLLDLARVAQELVHESSPNLPALSCYIPPFKKKPQSFSCLIETHKKILHSFTEGFTPLASIATQVKRVSPSHPDPIWETLGIHSIVIHYTYRPVIKNNTIMTIRVLYVDPTLAKEAEGKLILTLNSPHSNLQFLPSLESKTFLNRKKGHYLNLKALIGAFPSS